MKTPDKTILVTGFSPFPGAPVNPTQVLMHRLPKRLSNRETGIDFVFRVLPTTWAARADTTARLLEELQPDAVVHFGLDGTRRTINIETRAVNRATRIRPDASGRKPAQPVLTPGAVRYRPATLPARPLRDAALSAGAPAKISADAGTYLCNATLWDTLGSGTPAIFVHVPSLPRGRHDRRPGFTLIEEAAVRILLETARRLR
ncbi:pyroglutamyl-peptidase I [Roseibium aggregatum]|uniref:Pyrrolidone-carboxylate peptidase n=1 Tax=Roseibium aggregatum TaxID=187304 RepID=A0A939EG78_9HYPH|nr:pyroglutamyl-peptidase I [Roseibium aggregatum]MBN9671185.1 pyroglutamyl-peptidase I [Roseibium aggregatum]